MKVEELNCTAEEYRDHPGIGQSDLKMFARNKQLYYEIKIAKTRKPSPPTAAMQWGTDFEEYLRVGPSAFPTYEVLPADIKMRRGKKWDALRNAFPNVTFLTPKEWEEQGQRMADFKAAHDNIKRHDVAWYLLQNCEWHKRLTWECPITGLIRKAELDLYSEDVLVDLKTTSDNSLDGFRDIAFRLGYHIQAATYLDAYNASGPCLNADFYFIAALNKPPFNAEVFKASDEFLEAGRQWNEKWICRLAECVARPALYLRAATNDGSCILDLPLWAASKNRVSEMFLEISDESNIPY